MRPTPIPDSEVWEGAVRRVIAPPDGDLTNSDIAPCEALIDRAPSGAVNYSARCELEPGDLEKLQAGGVVWLTFWGHMVPWAATVVGPDVAGNPTLRVVVDPAGPDFKAWIDNLPESVDPVVFARGCIEALEHMLAEGQLGRPAQ